MWKPNNIWFVISVYWPLLYNFLLVHNLCMILWHQMSPKGWWDELGCSIVPHLDGTLITWGPGEKAPSEPSWCTAQGTDHWRHKYIIPHIVQSQPVGLSWQTSDFQVNLDLLDPFLGSIHVYTYRKDHLTNHLHVENLAFQSKNKNFMIFFPPDLNKGSSSVHTHSKLSSWDVKSSTEGRRIIKR